MQQNFRLIEKPWGTLVPESESLMKSLSSIKVGYTIKFSTVLPSPPRASNFSQIN